MSEIEHLHCWDKFKSHLKDANCCWCHMDQRGRTPRPAPSPLRPHECTCGMCVDPNTLVEGDGMGRCWWQLQHATHLALIEELQKALENYGNHLDDCVLTYWEAGEPTKDGGYRTMYEGKWYQTRPVDETPKCECGFDGALARSSALPKGSN